MQDTYHMIPSFSTFISEAAGSKTWLSKKRTRFPKPKFNESMWRKVSPSNTSEPTRILLDKFKELISDVSFFSYHPNISMSQYDDDHYEDDYRRFTSDRPDSSGHREWVDNSIIVKFKPGVYDDDWHSEKRNGDIPGKIIDKTFTWMKGQGGSGSGSDKTGYTLQFQPSFLYTHEKDAGTFEESNERRSRLTAGIFTQKEDGWYMVPSEEMDPVPDLEKEREKQAIDLAGLFELSPEVDKVHVNMGWNDKIEPIIHIKLNNKKTIEYHPTGWGTVNGKTQFFTKDTISIQIKGGKDWYYEMDGKLKTINLKEILDVVKLFNDEENEALGKHPEDYLKILHKYRGRLLGHTFDIA